MNMLRQVCTFFLEKRLFGIDIDCVQEVLRHQSMTPVPLAPREIHGLINLRGQIVAAIDLRTVLRLPPRESELEVMNVVIRNNDDVLSLLVDEIGDVLELDESAFESPPETIDKDIRNLVRGVYKLEGQLLLMLDTDKMIEFSSRINTI